MEDKIKGGLADNLSINDIAKKFNISVEDINNQVNMGIVIEMEHTNNEDIATEIALDHVAEIPDYYSRLKKMEEEAKQYWSGGKQINEWFNKMIK